MTPDRWDAQRSHMDSMWGKKIKERLTFHRTETLFSKNDIHHTHCLPRRSKGGYQCGGNDFFWNPSLTELTERSFFDEQRVKNASHRVSMPESVIDNPWQRLPSWCCETGAFPLLIQKIKPDNFGDLFHPVRLVFLFWGVWLEVRRMIQGASFMFESTTELQNAGKMFITVSSVSSGVLQLTWNT